MGRECMWSSPSTELEKEKGFWSEEKGHRHVYILKITECTFQNGGKDAVKGERLKREQRKWVE